MCPSMYICMCMLCMYIYSCIVCVCVCVCVLLGYAVAQWLGIRLQMLGVVMVAGVAFIAVLEHHFNSVDPGIRVYPVYVCVCLC